MNASFKSLKCRSTDACLWHSNGHVWNLKPNVLLKLLTFTRLTIVSNPSMQATTCAVSSFFITKFSQV